MNEDGSLREVVETVVKALVDYPDQVEVREVEGEATTVIELRVAQEALGKVIGKQGRRYANDSARSRYETEKAIRA